MTKIQYTILLLSVTLCWSAEMIFMKNIPPNISPFAILTMTNGIGAIILGTIFLKKIRKLLNKKILIYSIILSFMNILYNVLILYCLRFLNSASASFFISMTIAVIPIILFFMKRKVTKSNIAGIIIIIFGVVFTSEIKLSKGAVTGILIMIVVCFIRAFYLIKMNDFAKISDSAVLTISTITLVSLISFIIWFILEPKTFFSLTYSKPMISSIFSDGYFICAYAAFLNMIAQKYASPSTCSSIYAFQVIFSTVLSSIIPEMLGEKIPITFIHTIGCIVIFFGTIISEINLFGLIKNKLEKIKEVL